MGAAVSEPVSQRRYVTDRPREGSPWPNRTRPGTRISTTLNSLRIDRALAGRSAEALPRRMKPRGRQGRGVAAGLRSPTATARLRAPMPIDDDVSHVEYFASPPRSPSVGDLYAASPR